MRTSPKVRVCERWADLLIVRTFKGDCKRETEKECLSVRECRKKEEMEK